MNTEVQSEVICQELIYKHSGVMHRAVTLNPTEHLENILFVQIKCQLYVRLS